MASKQKYDVVVIGAGPGGYVSAVRCAQLGKKVAIIEKDRPGGLCLNWGCIPSKALLKSVELYDKLKKGGAFGIKVENVTFDINAIVDRSRGITDRIVSGVEYLFKKFKIEHIKGTAKLLSPTEIEVDTGSGKSTLEAKNIILATGTKPRDIPNLKRDGEKVISSKEALVLRKLPKQLVVIGAGAIGMEFAYYFRGLGSEVTVLEMENRVLPVEDDEISSFVQKAFEKNGVQLELESQVLSVDAKGKQVTVEYKKAGATKKITADVTLVAIGVVPSLEGLGLEKLGVETGRHGIIVNEHMQTTVNNIYAIGDVIGPPWLAHVASAEGVHAAEHINGNDEQEPIHYDHIPACTYCKPEVASVGYSERRCKEEGIDYKVGRFSFSASGRAIATGNAEGMVKLIFNKKYDELIGAHIVGGEATEMIHELALGLTLEATASEIGKTIHAHPTFGETIMEAALDVLGERIHGA